jgi:hypothetical protein
MRRFVRFAPVAALLVLASSSFAKERPPLNAYADAAPVAGPPEAQSRRAPPAFASSFDEKRGTPTFLWAEHEVSAPRGLFASRPAVSVARDALAAHAARWGASPTAAQSLEVAHVHDLGRGGVVVTFRQVMAGIGVFHGDVKVLLDRANDLVAIGGGLHPAVGATSKWGAFAKTDREALALALQDLYALPILASDFSAAKSSRGGYAHYVIAKSPSLEQAKISLGQDARVKPVWFALPDRLVPAYFVEVLAQQGSAPSDAYAFVVAADDGRMLYREHLTHDAAFDYRVFVDGTGKPLDGPIADFSPHPTGVPDGSYPAFAASTLLSKDGFNSAPGGGSDPWLAAGATQSTGNNVDAYTDDDAPDGFSGANDLRAAVSAPGAFDYVFDPVQGPQVSTTQRMAAVTQLFYVNNWLHDDWYDSGFDEAAGNAQLSNLGRGGVEGDPLIAQAQDGAPQNRNNANMSTFADGTSPRMQMYVWDGTGQSTSSLGVAPLGQTFTTGDAAFGPQSFSVTASMAVVTDSGGGSTQDGCESFVTNVVGKIGIVNRGTCSFKQKAVNAASAGAAGLIIIDNQVSGTPPGMGDGNPAGAVAIPTQSLTSASGTTLKNALQNGAQTGTMLRSSSVDRDGSIDNTIVAHEWGHYLHLRLVTACGNTQCGAMSEGWADFIALQMVVRQGDNLGGVFPLSVYSTISFPDDPAYFGIRRFPYSVDTTKNPLTFKHIQQGTALPGGVPQASSGGSNAEVHNAGEIWSTMMFEGYNAMLQKATGPNPPYTFDQARRRLADYVVAGMKLTPADPTYTEQRDGVLAAAAAADQGDMLLLAQGFADRGAGSCAVSPDRYSTTLQGIVESFALSPSVALGETSITDDVITCDGDGTIDAGETGTLRVEVKNSGTSALVGASISVVSPTPGITFPQGSSATVDVPAFGIVEVPIQVALDPLQLGKQLATFDVTAQAPSGCVTNATLTAGQTVDADEVLASSAQDDVEAPTSAWTPQGTLASSVWALTETAPGAHAWLGTDWSSPSDTYLVSPALDIGANGLVVTFQHRYQFEQSQNVNWDGGVIEVSKDGGQNWDDVVSYVDPGYDGTLGDPQNQATNVLKGRQGYAGQSASWPALEAVSLDFGQSLGQTSVLLRFRIGTDDAAGGYGWEIDNLDFQGITNTPFAKVVDDQSDCQGGTGGAGGGGGAGGMGAGGMGAGGTGAGGTGAGGTGAGGTGAGGTGAGGASTTTSSTGSGAGGAGEGGANEGGAGGGVFSPPPFIVNEDGCGCEIPGSRGSDQGLFAAGLAVLVAAFRRRPKRAR